MSFSPPISLLGSIEGARPVFHIVIGMFLMIFAWRLAVRAPQWTARFLMAGAFMLGFGYTLLLPLAEAGFIDSGLPRSTANLAAWMAVKTVTMNLGWLCFGCGLAAHAGILRMPTRAAKCVPALKPVLARHGTIA